MSFSRLRNGVAIFALLATVGCATSRSGGRRPAASISTGIRAVDSSGVLVVNSARKLIGSRYRYGGESRRQGFDCSGLTWYVWNRLGGNLPRTADEQAHVGSWVPLDELRPGDLLFFGPTREVIDHVGIVASRPGDALLMVHASTSQGVVETNVTSSSYWLQRLHFGRRVSG